MVKFQIVGSSLEILNGSTKIMVIPTKDIAIDSIALYESEPRAIIFNSNVGNNESLFEQILSQIVDENDVVFTVDSFISFATSNFGNNTTTIIPNSIGVGTTTPYKLISTATTNANTIKESAGTLYSIIAIGLSADVRFLKFYDIITPIIGTTIPIMTIPIPTNTSGAGFVLPFPLGVGFLNGISMAITSGSADDDAGDIGAGDVILNLTYA